MGEKTMRKLAKPMLFLAAFIWGSSFFIMKDALDQLPVQYLLAIRFTAGAALLGLLCWKKWRTFTPDYLWRGAVIGGMLYTAYAIQTYGLALTTPSKNAFLTAVYCVLVPFLYWAFARVRPDRYNVLAALLCVTGVGLVSLTGDLTVNPGDGLTLLCAIFYAMHIVSVAKVAPGKDIYQRRPFAVIFPARNQILHSHGIISVVRRKFLIKCICFHNLFHINDNTHSWFFRNLQITVHNLRCIF